MPVIRISQVDRLRLVLPVPESIVSRIRIGGPVEVRVDSFQRVFQGKVSRFSGRLETTTRTMETEVDIPNPNGAILPGMYGYATLSLDRGPMRSRFPCRRSSGAAQTDLLVFHRGREGSDRTAGLSGLETPRVWSRSHPARTGGTWWWSATAAD